jgi:hypothetical protein
VRWLVLAAALCGCDKVFGLSELGAPDAAGHDSGVARVTGTRTLRYIDGDPGGVPQVVQTPYGAGELTIAAALRDGTALPVTLPDPAAATFSIDVPAGEVYTVAFSRGSAPPYEIEASAALLSSNDTRYGRPDGVVAPAGTTLEFDNIPFAAAEWLVATTGSWTEVAAPLPTAGSSTVLWAGQPLLDGSRGDRAYLIDQVNQGSYKTIAHVAQAAPVMVAGTTTKVSASGMAAVASAACKYMAVDPSVTMRAVRPGFTASNAYWQLFATPAPEYGFGAALQIAISTSTLAVDAKYANVYPGMKTIAASVGQSSRAIASPNPSGTNLYTTIAKFVSVDDASTCTAPDLSVEVGVPGTISIQGVALGSDHAQVTAAGVQRIAVTWDLATTGPVDYYDVQLIEVPAELGPLAVRRDTVTLDREVVYDPAIFEPGHEYFLQIGAVRGVPQASSGDFTTFANAAELAYVNSPTFTVAR